MDLNVLGLPKAKETQLRNAGLNSVEEVSEYFPKKYIDYSRTMKINTTRNDDVCRIVATVEKVTYNPRAELLKITVKDTTAKMDMIWFHAQYPQKILTVGTQAVFAGVIKFSTYGRQMVSPLFSLNLNKFKTPLPIYKKVKGMSDDYLSKTIMTALESLPKEEYLDEYTFSSFGLFRRYLALRGLHEPPNMAVLDKSQNRIMFDDLFKFSYIMATNAEKYMVKSPIKVETFNNVKPFLESLPFSLTDGDESQLSTVRKICLKLKKGYVTNSLVQGDVGCGKTMVAILMSIVMAENGYSTAIMAPTNILAKQHYEEFCKLFNKNDDINPIFFASGMKTKERREAIEGIKDGKYNVVIGTHALLSDKITFNNLGLVIIDEEHRFGVEQRAKLTEDPVNVITMSATPIPRSLALTIYGENTDIYTIKKMPAGRMPVETTIENDIKNAYKRINEEVGKGHQAYIVCPLIDETDSEKMSGVISVNERYKEITALYPSLKVGLISGKMKQDEINQEINKFKDKIYDVLVSTTIVEVGVNVPNSTLIVISNAERFGIATLHQLRGRVGRSSFKSYCILQTPKENNERLNIMTLTTDGFVIAKKDLELRGMGDFIGTAQSGDNKAVSLMILNEDLYMKIRERISVIRKDEILKDRYDKYFELDTKEEAD